MIFRKIETKMAMEGRAWIILIIALVVLAYGIPARAGETVKDEAAVDKVEPPDSQRKPMIPLTEYLSLGLKTEAFVGSHTSYEFGNPFPPNQAPLSRLEFPMDSWWIGGKLRAGFPRFSVGAEALTNIAMDTSGHMRDSDWDDDENPSVKTIYSESKCRIAPSWIVRTDIDLKISDWIGLPAWLDLRPLVGFRWQNLHFVTHDGSQAILGSGEPPTPLPGDGIDFEQTYWQYFVGARAAIDLGKPPALSSLAMLLQFDWGYVEGQNLDHHLLRSGRRYTLEETYGDAWHWSAGVRAGLTKHISLALEGDFLRISTTGWHRLLNPDLAVDLQFTHGVKVWSDQTSVSLTLAYEF